MAKTRTRTKLTAGTIVTAADMLRAGVPYTTIAKKLNVSAATIGRLKGVMNGKVNKGNARIAALLATGQQEKGVFLGHKGKAPTKSQEMDTQCEQPHTMSGLLDELEADLAKVNRRCEQIRKLL